MGVKSAVDSCLFFTRVNGRLDPRFDAGWSLIGLKSNQAESITDLISENENKITSIWKWAETTWAVYLPQYGPADTETYANGKGFGVLSTINPGEGFWINCTEEITLE